MLEHPRTRPFYGGFTAVASDSEAFDLLAKYWKGKHGSLMLE